MSPRGQRAEDGTPPSARPDVFHCAAAAWCFVAGRLGPHAGRPRQDTAPEVAIRRALHAAGHRFRVLYRVPGNRRRSIESRSLRPRWRCPSTAASGTDLPSTGASANSDWWTTKLVANKAPGRRHRPAPESGRLVRPAHLVARRRIGGHGDGPGRARRGAGRRPGRSFLSPAVTQRAVSSRDLVSQRTSRLRTATSSPPR